MLIDLIAFDSVAKQDDSFRSRAFSSVINVLRRKLGLTIGYDSRTLAFEDAILLKPARLAQLLKDSGVIQDSGPANALYDEPQLYSYYATCNIPTKHQTGGSSFENNAQAYMASLAEGLERYIWYTQTDFFERPILATESEIAKRGRYIAPSRWTSFSAAQRAAVPDRTLSPDAKYLWIRGYSLVNKNNVFIPAQTVTGVRSVRTHGDEVEPLIRNHNTIGLATWTDRDTARLAGALEVIEREAFMIMWLNQLTLPRIQLAHVCTKSASLAKIVAACERYRLRVHAVRMLTDAPTHAICVILEDLSGLTPRFTVGLKAHRSIEYAIEKAITEALRARRGVRNFFATGGTFDNTIPVVDIGHRDRLYYWAQKPEGLEFLIEGAEEEIEPSAWDDDSTAQNLARITDWCKKLSFECISVTLDTSKRNPTDFKVEMVALPDLVPTYLREGERAFGGSRLASVPRAFGYEPRNEPFTDAPHPFS